MRVRSRLDRQQRGNDGIEKRCDSMSWYRARVCTIANRAAMRTAAAMLTFIALLVALPEPSIAETLTVVPANSTAADAITIGIDGRAPVSPSTPYVRDVSVSGQVIRVNECFGVPAFFSIGAYHDVATVGQLQPGRYSIELYYQICDHMGTILTPLGLVATAQFDVAPSAIPSLTPTGLIAISLLMSIAFVWRLRAIGKRVNH